MDSPGDVGALLDRLRAALGADRVLDRRHAAEEIRRRSLNPASDPAPHALVQPQTTAECRIAMELLGTHARPIGGLTTFWEPQPLDGTIGIDVLALRNPSHVDVDARIGCFGAGTTVRDVDRRARADGLCLVAYPDSDGAASVGSMAAVACTAGLGTGRVLPVEQIVGLTIVTPAATIVKTGAAWRRGHVGIAHGAPDPTGIFLGSQGGFGVITEVALALAPAPFLAARTWREPWRPLPSLADALRRARAEIDRGAVDSLRLEAVGAGSAPPSGVEWLARCWAPESSQAADERCATLAARLGARDARGWIESPAGRRGELPDHDARYSLPPGTHHDRTGRDGFLGVEVNVNWGEQLGATLQLFDELLAAVRRLAPGYLRLGVYPAAHTLSVGVQAMLSGGTATADAVRDALAAFVGPLYALGAIPYRPGRLWRSIAHHDDPAAAIVRRAGG